MTFKEYITGTAVMIELPHGTSLGKYEIRTNLGKKIIELGFDDLQEVRNLVESAAEELGLNEHQIGDLTKEIRRIAKKKTGEQYDL